MLTIHFLRPYFLLLFIPLLLIAYALYHLKHSNTTWEDVCDPHLLPHLLIHVQQHARFILPFILLCASTLTILALAGPSHTKTLQTVYQKQQATLLVLDLSTIMYDDDLKPDRLQRAKFKIEDILKQQKEGRIGLIVFSAAPFIVSPLTQDAATIQAMIPNLSPNIMPIEGANIGIALKKAQSLLQQGGAPDGHIILLTANSANPQDITIAKRLAKRGGTISVLAIRSKENTSTEIVDSLTALAKAGKGRYQHFTTNENDINTLLSLQTHAHLAAKKTKEKTSLWKDEGRYLLFLLLPIALWGFRRGYLERMIQ